MANVAEVTPAAGPKERPPQDGHANSEAGKTSLFGGRGQELPPGDPQAGAATEVTEILRLRLEAIATRVKSMHDAWRAERHGADGEAMQLEAGKVATRLDPIIARIERHAAVSLHVRDLKAQRVLYDHQGEALRNPASNQKMLTAAAALDLLGPEYRFDTKVFGTGDELVLVGEGDPSLTLDRVVSITKDLAAHFSMRDVRRIVVDDHAFSSSRFIPGAELDDVGEAFAAPTGALSVDGNSVAVSISPGRSGAPALVRLGTDNRHVNLDSTATTARAAGDPEGPTELQVRSNDLNGSTVIEVRGRIPADHEPVRLRRRIVDPSAYAGDAFASALAATAGLTAVPSVVRGSVPANAHLLASWKSVPLIELLQSAMAFSNNFAMEQILRTLAWRMTARPGDWELGKLVIEAYWDTIGVNPEALVVKNGSGLSREGRFTARGLVDLLSATYLTQVPNSGLFAVLPIAGKPGTLQNRLLDARGRLRAKTGTLNDVSCLSGILSSPTGDAALGLSVMLNPGEHGALDVSERHRAENDIVVALVKFLDGRDAWNTRGRNPASRGRSRNHGHP